MTAPCPVRASSGTDHRDRVTEPVIGLRAAEPEELQTTNDVEVPLGWKRKPGECPVDHIPGSMGFEQSMPEKEIATTTERIDDRYRTPVGLICEQRLEDGDRSMERPVPGSRPKGLTIPAPVVEC